MTQKDLALAIARVAHEVNRQYCASHGDLSHQPWDSAPKEIQDSSIHGVKALLEKPDNTPEQSHIAWMTFKVNNGWVYGPVKDFEKKEHPCLVPYAELDERQRAKDYIFRGVVRAIAQEMTRP